MVPQAACEMSRLDGFTDCFRLDSKYTTDVYYKTVAQGPGHVRRISVKNRTIEEIQCCTLEDEHQVVYPITQLYNLLCFGSEQASLGGLLSQGDDPIDSDALIVPTSIVVQDVHDTILDKDGGTVFITQFALTPVHSD